jgi:endonuclease YncB( thermonuclease family)
MVAVMSRPHRLVPPRSGRVLAFEPRRRRPIGGWGEAARGLGPIGLALPLAAFAAVLLWGGPPAAAIPRELNGAHAQGPHDRDVTPKALDAQQPGLAAGGSSGTSLRGDREAARFSACFGRHGANCTIDGDSLMYQGRQIRIADIDTPEIGSPKCPGERARGEAAQARLQALLNAGPFRLEPADRARDRFGRELFVITRGGASLGETLVAEGLAHPWVGHKLPWC